jgi:hypothetical protein
MSNEYRFKDVNAPSDIEPVGWYDPSQLLDTASRVTESESFARNSDRRVNFTEWEEEKLTPITFYLNEEPSGNQPNASDTQSPYNNFYIGSHRKTTDADIAWKSELWVDFLADTGDGGNATYTVAKTLFQDPLALTYHMDLGADNPIRTIFPKGLSKPLPRADLLVLGGDLVYPVANDETYQTRFINFLIAALPKNITFPKNQKEATRAVLSFPQNHDWYDNLSSFFLLFCHKEKDTFFDMKCPQWQSYAAVKLPFDWWLFGFDLALSDDIDEIQYLYFSKIIEKAGLNENSRIIITYKEPVWTLTALGNSKNLENLKYREHAYFYENLEAIIEAKTGREIDIRLAGDQHYYRRYSKKILNPQSHLITCGSGGAFLHPTHGPKEFDQIDHVKPRINSDDDLFGRTYQFSDKPNPPSDRHTTYEKMCDYPSSKESWGLSKGNFRFCIINPWFGSITAFSYLLLVWANFSSLYSNISKAEFDHGQDLCYKTKEWFNSDPKLDWFDNMSCAWRLWSWSSILTPVNGVIGLFIIFGFAYFAQKFNPHAKIWAGVIGALHGLAHFFAVFVVYYFILKYQDNEPRDPIHATLEFLPFSLTACYVLAGGFIVGSTIMGMYLFISLNLYSLNVQIITLTSVFTLIWFVFSLWFADCLIALIPTLITTFLLIFIFIMYKHPFIHSNEAFSSLKIQDYKGFLRFKITKERLEAYFIGIDQIPTKWKKSEQGQPKWEATDKAIQPKLVDYWTVETPTPSKR